MLNIKNITVGVDEKTILKGLNLLVREGELHVIMGRNGAGKSTLANILSGSDKYKISSGEIIYKDQNIDSLSPEERSHLGLFMSFQYPVAIPGVNTMVFLRTALNSIRKARGEDEVDAADFLKIVKKNISAVGLDESFIHRSLNDGFSGGEKKRNEILQLLTLEPDLAILDETDSGLDIDALNIVASGINNYKNKKRSIILITHYQRILEHLDPDYVHILMDGKIVKSGGIDLANKIEEQGFSWLRQEA